MRYLFTFLLLATMSPVACGGNDEPAAAPDRIEGVIVAIDSAAIDDVNGFTIKDRDQTYEVLIASDVDYGFPLGHLQEHVQTSDRVAVELEIRDGLLYALTIEDI